MFEALRCRHFTIATVISFVGTWPAVICVPKILLRPTNVLRPGKAVGEIRLLAQMKSVNFINSQTMYVGLTT